MKLGSLLFGAALGREHFFGDKVFRITIESQQDLKTFEEITAGFDTWKEAKFIGDVADVHVPKEFVEMFTERLQLNQVSYENHIDDVENLVEEIFQGAAPRYSGLASFNYNKYHRFDDYQSWQTDFAAENSDLVEILDYGTSFEGRTLNFMKIGKGSKKIIMHGGTHAREWITPITMINTVKKLVDENRAGGANAKYLDDITWYIAISVNPDGYEYTWDGNRMWRRTRNTNTPTNCVGSDPNRNWDASWATVGASSNPCSDTYHGPSVFSEVETKLLSEFILSVGEAQGYADVHAYSQYWMFPYGYQRVHTPSHTKLNKVSKDIVDAIESVHRSRFVYGSIFEVIYPASGSSCDWAYDTANIPCSFAPELRDRGRYGFLLPEDQIQPTAEEMWAGFTAWADNVIDGICDSK